jgi:ATP-dependent DNA helicase PIF1
VPTAHSLDFNPEFLRAIQLLEGRQSVFLTGKAGTGKSTLLKHFLDTTTRAALVVAPTGVAALNVNGQTIHRLFSFPSTVTPEFAMSADYFPRSNREAIKKVDVLVVDEVSMVRADLLDAMEIALKRFGPKPGEPFGGVQMVFVGDPYQLPPVTLEAESYYFRTRYSTPYFFSADAFKALDYEIIQLEKVYRQSDSEFVNLLNAIRTGEAKPDVYARLNQNYKPEFIPNQNEFWVTLTTTNAMADSENGRRLETLETPMHTVAANVWGEISPSDFPTQEKLSFRIGAQVMLVNNDGRGLWVNGSIGIITDIDNSRERPSVEVLLRDTGETVWVESHTWEITRPRVDEGRIVHDVVGSFEQLPFKLAWAVTIHKSQGKTLDRVIVSLGRGTFSDGQLYVALSRCTSLDGLVLKSEVKPHHVKVEREVTRFLARASSSQTLVEAEGLAFLGIITTGYTRFDRILELGLVVERPNEVVEYYSSLINPLRDVGSSEDHGISASDVSTAPTFMEAWPFFARRMDGCAIVCHGRPMIQTMIEREASSSDHQLDLGLGFDTSDSSEPSLRRAMERIGFELSAIPSALDIAIGTAELFRSSPQDVESSSPFTNDHTGARIGRVQSRDHLVAHWAHGRHPLSIEYSDYLSMILSFHLEDVAVTDALESFSNRLSIDTTTRRDVNEWAIEQLAAAAVRDGSTSSEERLRIEQAARILGLNAPLMPETGSTPISEFLFEGAKVCFTGSATDAKGKSLDRGELESIAKALGLTPVATVTIKGCDAVIAADASSMSGKAKKARDLGKPVFSVADFMTWSIGEFN